MDRKVIDAWFRLLAEQLEKTELATEAGPTRHAHPSEFMLMHETPLDYGRIVHFKHRFTRNYVCLVAQRGQVELYVPNTGEPFHRGTFEVPEQLQEATR